MRLATRLFSARGPLVDSVGMTLASQQKEAQTSGETKAVQDLAHRSQESPKKFYDEIRCTPGLFYRSPPSCPPLYISHLKWITGQNQLVKYFQKFGVVQDISMYFDSETGIHKGLASVTFEDPKSIEKVLTGRHVIDGEVIHIETETPRIVTSRVKRMRVYSNSN